MLIPALGCVGIRVLAGGGVLLLRYNGIYTRCLQFNPVSRDVCFLDKGCHLAFEGALAKFIVQESFIITSVCYVSYPFFGCGRFYCLGGFLLWDLL